MKKCIHMDRFLRAYACQERQCLPSQQDYRALVQALRLYIDTLSLPTTSIIGDTSLLITRHPQRHTANMQLLGPTSRVGFFGIYHHGIEELFFFRQHSREQPIFIRSLRHHLDDDETMTNDMRRLCATLLALSENGEKRDLPHFV